MLSESNFVRVVILLISLFGVITLYLRHKIKSEWLNEDLPYELLRSQYLIKLDGSNEIEAAGFNRRRKWFRSSFWYEALIFLICPLPFDDSLVKFWVIDINKKDSSVAVYYLISDFILALMFFRLFFVMRAVFNYNMFTDVVAKKLCRSYGFTANVRFTYKCLLKEKPTRTVSFTMMASVIILAYCLRVFEVQYYTAIN